MGLSENQMIAIFLNINQHDSQTNDSQWLMAIIDEFIRLPSGYLT